MIAAHFPLPPLTSAAGRRARSAQAVAASETCTDASVSSAVRCPGVRSFHRVLLLVPMRVMVVLPVLGDSGSRRPLRGRPVALMLVRAPPAVNA